MEKLDELKRHVFFEFLNLTGRALIIVNYSKDLIFGKRAFTQSEKANGITLAFNSKMDFIWDEDGIKATLIFGSRPEKCLIHSKNIAVIFSPELGAHFIDGQADKMHSPFEKTFKKKEGDSGEDFNKVIEVDFTKNRQRGR